MTPISKVAQKTFDALVRDLPVGEERIIGKPGGSLMPLHVERLSENTYSLAHYYEQNGDLVPDPDGTFWRGPDGRVYPMALQQCTGLYTEAMIFADISADASNRAVVNVRANDHAQRELAQFAAMWLRNIRWQQEDYFKAPPSTTVLQAEPERGQA